MTISFTETFFIQSTDSDSMTRAWVLSLMLVGVLLAGCIGSTDEDSDVDRQSIPGEASEAWGRAIPETITGIDHVTDSVLTQEGKNGAGIWLQGDHAYVSGLGTGFHVLDISTPEEPVLVGSIDGETLYSRDADFITYPDGREVAVLATQSGGMTFVNVTDPADPQVLSILEIEPNHNVAVVPGTTIVYNSPSTGEGRPNEIVDASDPLRPEVVAEFGDFGCHDTTFYVSEDGSKARAYCAGVDTSQIWDIADPLDPELITGVSNPCMDPDPLGTDSVCQGLHHSAMVNHDASILILGDEFMGGGGPGCGAHLEAGGMSQSTPIGALWFYDISDEENPELLSWFAPDIPVDNHAAAALATAQNNPTAAPFAMSCTSHFGELVPGKEMLVMAWYHAGVMVLDFSDPANPLLVDQWNDSTTTWDAQIHNGYIFTGDITRGSDVLTFAGE